MKIRQPTESEAHQYALMLHVGLPVQEAIQYFLSDEERLHEVMIAGMMEKWNRSKLVREEVTKLLGKGWEEMSLDERVGVAIDKHYAEMAYFLFSHNFGELGGADWSKSMEARKVLEAKMAGTSGTNPMEDFWRDIKSGKIQLGRAIPVPAPETHLQDPL